MDQERAIRRCLAGDADAFALIIQIYQSQILGLCLRITGHREDATDLAQLAFIKAFRHLHQYDQSKPFRPWLFRIATNECIGFLRQRRHIVMMDDQALAEIPDATEGAATRLELAEDRERVRQAVSSLPPPYQSVVLSYYFQEMSYQEIATENGIPVGTVGVYLFRAKQMLKRLLQRQEVIPHDAPAV